jgi:D-glucuronyl C5-epimerase C-terminus
VRFAKRPLRAIVGLAVMAFAALASASTGAASLAVPHNSSAPIGLSQQLQPLSRAPRARHHSARAASAPVVLAAITHLRRAGAIASAAATRYRNAYLQAQHTLSHLSGTSHAELANVVGNITQIAGAGGLTSSRMPAIFLTLERNREWWARGSSLSYGDRVSFPGSRLVWEYYPGQGIELQWLATFGEANGYYLSGNENAALRQVLDEAQELGSDRAGGIAWEYFFHFDGGSPPWTSGLSQGTAIQAFARAAQRLHEPAFETVAQEALGIFEQPPPAGVRLQIAPPSEGRPALVHYLEYSFAPAERILNGFIQSLNGLYDFTKITGSTTGLRLFEEGDADARTEVPHYDTGAWSLYDQHSESDLGYHELLAEFLQDLCQRTRQGPPLTASSTSTGGTSGSTSAQTPSRPQPIPGDAIYCSTATHFFAYLHTAPVISLLSKTLPANARAGVQFSLSKIATLSITITHAGKVVWTNSATVEAGKPRLLWITPKHPGAFTVDASAVDLAGNRASISGEVRVSAPHKSR